MIEARSNAELAAGHAQSSDGHRASDGPPLDRSELFGNNSGSDQPGYDAPAHFPLKLRSKIIRRSDY